MRRAVALLLVIPLCGCFADQKQQLAQCKLAALEKYSGKGDTDFGPTRNAISIYNSKCMAAHGYEDNLPDKRCQVTFWDAGYDNPYCYAPSGWLARKIYRIETSEVDE
jgi:hypothetical protein